MSVFVATVDGRVLQYDSPQCTSTDWIRHENGRWKIYWRNCTCADCTNQKHENLIAYIPDGTIVSIGFERPFTVEGRLLNSGEKSKVVSIRDWLAKRNAKGTLPRKVVRQIDILDKLAK